MNVRLVTTWNTACGIAEHSWHLKQAVEAADPSIVITPDPGALDPVEFFKGLAWSNYNVPTILHLNYHAALHSRWTADRIILAQAAGLKVLVTYHDTGVPNSDQCKQIAYVLRPRLDAMVVHEPFDDLPIEKTRYWRMGVPAASSSRLFAQRGAAPSLFAFKAWEAQPVLGTIGFPFGWKNYDELARLTRSLGWALLLIAPTATPEQVATWTARNPDILVRSDFVPRHEAIALLAGCDATAFAYVCHNAGQSAAILQGIAARKPVIALSTCRQFRALYLDPLGRRAIRWCATFEEIGYMLCKVRIARVEPSIVALAEQDGWAQLGQKYTALYHELNGQ